MSIRISPKSADAFNSIGIGDFFAWENNERMAYLVLILKKLPDDEKTFPLGKWATIQSIEQQLDENVNRWIKGEGKDDTKI